MDVIDRYFRTLRILLPKDQRDDIIRELSEEVQSQVAEKEAALGRRLEADEQAAIVGQYGHPLLTAARYRPQRHVIGPVVFPYYWIVLRVTLVLVAMGHVLGAAVLLAHVATAGSTEAAPAARKRDRFLCRREHPNFSHLRSGLWRSSYTDAAEGCHRQRPSSAGGTPVAIRIPEC